MLSFIYDLVNWAVVLVHNFKCSRVVVCVPLGRNVSLNSGAYDPKRTKWESAWNCYIGKESVAFNVASDDGFQMGRVVCVWVIYLNVVARNGPVFSDRLCVHSSRYQANI